MAKVIVNENAYERAIRARMVQNARTTWLRTYGDVAHRILNDAIPRTSRARSMIGEGREEELFFLDKLAYGLDTYGKLSEKQTLAYVSALDKAEVRKQEREAARQAQNATLNYVGTVGERMTFKVKIAKVTEYWTQSYNHWQGDELVFVTIMNDAAGNVIVYKGGKPLGSDGEEITVVARVKDHREYKGQKQTVLTRPTVK